MRYLCKLSFISIIILSGCNGNGSDGTFEGSYAGVWDVRYNLREDECQMVENGVLGFVDIHEITQEGTAVTLNPSSGFGIPLQGTVDASFNLHTEQDLVSSSFFGDGIPCRIHQGVSYEPLAENRASTIFVREISCDDGFTCASRAAGESVRR
jgi:hypothetical protein